MESRVVLKEKNPHENANILSKLFLWWSFKLFKRGYKTGLTLDDLWQARSVDQSGRLGDRLEEAWEKELETCRKNKTKPSLSKAIVSCFWVEYMTCGIFVGILFIIVWPLIPYTLGLFIKYFASEKTPESYRNAHIHNLLLNILSILSALMINHTNLSQVSVGMRVRIAACSLMYRKVLKLNRVGMSKTDSGQVINLMSNDVSRFDMASSYLNYVWVMPIMVPVVSYLVWQHIGYATLAALGVIFIQTVVVQAYLSSRQGVLREKIAKRTDQRVKVMSELVNGVQVIKMFAWEKPFEKLVDKLRKMEIKYILRTSFLKGFSMALSLFSERFNLFAAVVTFVVIGGEISSHITFSLLQYYNLMQLACNIFFPLGLVFLAESKVSIRRIEEFLELEELESDEAKTISASGNILNGIDKNRDDLNNKVKPTGLVITNATASWQPNPTVDTLRNITLNVQPGEFIGVAGLVGSGKSSLLQLVLGELYLSKGTVSVGGAKVSYASQEPWLFMGSVKQNILFGLPYDRLRYKNVVTACALLRDFEQLPAGDSTLVGERGISLSGGQRARIGLARACYRNADIYLLDDPLSAVDTHVGKHILSECLLGLLQHSTRILVTHQLHHLKQTNRVVILHNGEIETTGNFEEVSKSSVFKDLEEEDQSTGDPGIPVVFRNRTLSNKDKFETNVSYEEISQNLSFEGSKDEDQSTEDPVISQVLMQRMLSSQSHSSLNSTAKVPQVEEEEPQETDELMETGRVSTSVYKKYFRAGANWCLLLTTVLSILLAQVSTTASDLWLTYWMNTIEERSHSPSEPLDRNLTSPSFMSKNETFTTETTLYSNSTTMNANLSTIVNTTFVMQDIISEEPINHMFYIYVWGAAILGCILLTTGRSILFLYVCMKSSIKLHNQMFSNILSATMRFFDTNPSGRILNRFSKDMGSADEMLPNTYLHSIQTFMVMTGILVLVAIVNPYMLLTTLVCGIFMYMWTKIYLSTAQAIKRVECVSRSPVFSHVSASMAGLATIRACDAVDMLKIQFDDKQNVHTAAWFLTVSTNTTFAIWLSLISASYVIVVAYTFLLWDDGTTTSGNVGVAISQGLILVNMVEYGIQQTTEVLSQMTSVERVLQFTKLPKEVTDGPSPPKGWPQRGKLIFKDLYLRYDEDAEPVLKNLNIVIESGWKVGVVGRTGAGKSSLISALFRLAPIDGNVFIDEVETGEIALKDLRSNISIIPQEPILFSASLRYNLDPFDKYTDADIWNALEQVELKNIVSSLSAEVESGGVNFSAGQRQLLCLARAALAKNKLLVLDEATANVDANTDALIQKSIRKHFSDCTVITVAHRLHTVADADRVIVMDGGQILECGHPHELLQKTDGNFLKMVQQLSGASEQRLRELAHNAYLEYSK